MATERNIQRALAEVHDQQSFFRGLLGDTLDWPVGDATDIGEIAYGWSEQDLNAADLKRHLVEGSVWQIQPSAKDQPWGVFVLEFRHEDALSPGRGMAGILRKVLRGLVGSRRRDPKLPAWKREHLLFICTYHWAHFRFAYFRSRPDEPRSARLVTFGWAPGIPRRTVCEFNLPALVWPDDPSDAAGWVAGWAKAFDKEPLTRDFFRRFDKALEAIKGDLEQYQNLSPTEAYTRSQLLLERLIFLYFLQNRGWLNQERHYLPAALDQHADPGSFSYYHEFLDKLFWTLSTAPGGPGRLPGIPFLNGGLFDDDEFRQPTVTRKTSPPLNVRNRTMRYVFTELLEAFNFTVTEDTPLNQEVAVDPEMLGKVFESIVLHAEAADPDAVAPDKRKATGSYYTPRIVVHFICREVLYQYLLNHLSGDGWGPRLRTLLAIDLSDGLDEEEEGLLRKVVSPEQAAEVLKQVEPLKCCDPAVGSGAFPVGLMQELVNLRRVLETAADGYRDPVVGRSPQWLHDTKAHIVENCLFGVDIQQQAIEICRLRLWLSLVVDYDLGLDPLHAERRRFQEAISRISQLPNLEMNFRRGDSLHDHICGVPVVVLRERASHHASDFAAIARLGADLHKAQRSERKKKLRVDILEKRLELSRKVIEDELRLIRQRDSALDRLFGEEESDAEKRKRNQREMGHLEHALAKVETDREQLEKLRRREADSQFYVKLRKLEGADFDSPFNFAWHIDFPAVFGANGGGFDIIVGNPPFVTARNREKRELYSERWPRVCAGNYQLLCPFFELSFGLLHAKGELGFIVSNAFAKRDIGKPLVERFFPTVRIQKVVDCSGLRFPGHGTPTCLIFGKAPGNDLLMAGRRTFPVRVAAILPGGGDLRTPPEESGLWRTLAEKHDQPGFSDERVTVADRGSGEMYKWPWKFIAGDDRATAVSPAERLSAYCIEPVGAQFITGKDETFVVSGDYARRLGAETANLRAYGTGEDIRNWSVRPKQFIVFPYDRQLAPLSGSLPPWIRKHLAAHREVLENCVISGSIKKKETNLKWFEFRRLARAKFNVDFNVLVPHISTHAHFLLADHAIAFKEKAIAVALKRDFGQKEFSLLLGLLNSSLILEWFKQVCFSKREAEEADTDTYYEFAGGKVEDTPICDAAGQALGGTWEDTAETLAALAQACSEHGEALRGLDLRKVFEKRDEAYQTWNCSLPGSVAPRSQISSDWRTVASLRTAVEDVKRARETLRGEMIALQEEMDWLVYALYGVLSENPATQVQSAPEPLQRGQRPFRLWEQAEGSYEKAVGLIPSDWNAQRRQLWEARLAAIRDNEHIRRIEQPVYKRRWDEQWKVANQWRCGDMAYAAEFLDAFEWWLKEKAEWWLEDRKAGGPVELSNWTRAIWDDGRVRAAWPVAAEQYAFLEDVKAREKAEGQGDPPPAPSEPATSFTGFERKFRETINEESVPEGYPFGVAYEELEKRLKKKLPAQLRKVRGKLNVPRERFHLDSQGRYKWAGLQFGPRSPSA